MSPQDSTPPPPSKRAEFLVFVLLVLALVPALCTALIGGYGLLAWLMQ